MNTVASSTSSSSLKMSDTEAEAETGEKFSFESNVSRVMDIIINSLYSNKDVFIRELISNAADACDKKRFKALTESVYEAGSDDLKIRVSANRDANTLIIEDTGIGMNKGAYFSICVSLSLCTCVFIACGEFVSGVLL